MSLPEEPDIVAEKVVRNSLPYEHKETVPLPPHSESKITVEIRLLREYYEAEEDR